MKRIVLITIIAVFSAVCFDHAQAQVSSPLYIQFRKQVVHRLVFDYENAISLSTLKPSKIVKLEVEHLSIKVSGAATSYKVDNHAVKACMFAVK